MNKSGDINELATALVKTQSVLEGAKQDANNPFFKSKYATLHSVWEACRKPLTNNGLSVVQTMDDEGGSVTIVTTLLHTSGQWISGRLRMILPKEDPQGIGSAITYARRYSLESIVGLSPVDDDAESAMKRGKQGKPPQTTPLKTQLKTLYDTAKAKGWEDERIKTVMLERYGATHSSDLKPEEVKDFMNLIKEETNGKTE